MIGLYTTFSGALQAGALLRPAQAAALGHPPPHPLGLAAPACLSSSCTLVLALPGPYRAPRT